jgi:hypothetical protein
LELAVSDDLEPEIFVKLSISFKAIRVIGNKLIPTLWKVAADVYYNEDESEDSPNDNIDVQGAFAKIHYWFNNFVDSSVLFGRSNEWARNAFISEEGHQSITNNVALLPQDPTDEVLAQIFQSKMNALAGGFVKFGLVEIISDDRHGLSFTYAGESGINFPDMYEWIGEWSFFENPWWERDDASMIDIIPMQDADLTKLPKFAISLDFIVDQIRPANQTLGQLIRPDFKPIIHNGGFK